MREKCLRVDCACTSGDASVLTVKKKGRLAASMQGNHPLDPLPSVNQRVMGKIGKLEEVWE